MLMGSPLQLLAVVSSWTEEAQQYLASGTLLTRGSPREKKQTGSQSPRSCLTNSAEAKIFVRECRSFAAHVDEDVRSGDGPTFNLVAVCQVDCLAHGLVATCMLDCQGVAGGCRS